MLLYAGTYTKKDSQGIYTVELKDKTLKKVSLKLNVKSPKYLSYYNGTLFSIYEDNNKAGVLAENDNGLFKCLFEDIASTYLACFDNYIYTANYHLGSISMLKFQDNEIHHLLTVKDIKFLGAHQIILHDKIIIVPCLKTDEINFFDKELKLINTIKTNKNSGPRHGVIVDNNLVIVTELSNELLVFDLKNNQLIQQIKLSEDLIAVSAGITFDNKRSNLFISIRGINKICWLKYNGSFKVYKYFSSFGDHPRFIHWVEKEELLLIANLNSNELVSFDVDNEIVTSKVEIFEVIVVSEKT